MIRHEPDSWQEECRLVIGEALVIPAAVSVWSYNGKWGGEARVATHIALSEMEKTSLLIEFGGPHPVKLMSVSHRAPGTTTVHFVGEGAPPFSPSAVLKAD